MSARKLIPAVGYARRSTDMQETSIPDQRAYVEKWAAERGYRVLRWYVDDAISGTSARGREAFERMLRDAEHGRDFDAVLVYDISRFSRGGTNETGYYLHRLKLAGVEVVFAAEGIPEGDEGELLQGVKSWQARQYSVKLARDTIRGQLSHLTQRRSRLGSQAPFGYDRQYRAPDGKVLRLLREMPDGSRQELAPDGTLLRTLPRGESLPKAKSDIVRLVPGPPERVRVVRQMFEWCVGGVGLRTIAMRLNAAGVRTPMGRRWEHSTVSSILRNPVYKGALDWNRTNKSRINAPSPDGSLRPPARNPNGERNSPDLWVLVENVHEPLVSADLWQRAQEEIDRRSRMGGLARPTNRYLLSGLVKCTRCGMNFTGRRGGTGGQMRYYMDGAYMRYGRMGCDPTYLNAENLDAFVLAQVRRLVAGDRAAVEKAVDRFVKMVQTRARPDDRRGRVEAELKAVQKRIASVVALLADGELDDLAELRDALVGLRKRRAALEAELAAVGARAATPVNAADLRAWAFKRLAELGKALATGHADETLRQVVQSYVVRVDIDPLARRGVLLLPADTLAILERDALAFSRVKPADAGPQPRGKQIRRPEGIWYTPTTGLWQTVWLEPVPEHRIEDPGLVADATGRLTVTLDNRCFTRAHAVDVVVLDGGKEVARATGAGEIKLTVPQPRLWSPDDPFLYDVRITLRAHDDPRKVVDEVTSYVGFRSITLGRDGDGPPRVLLNGRPVFMLGTLDQGFWPDGLYTPPTDAALKHDLDVTKQLGFNTVRKHVKVESRRWYAWCDRLGLLVWQDMPSGDLIETRGEIQRTPESAAQFERELDRLVATHRNHPCIVVWVPFNEGWGQYDTRRIAARVKQLDPTRLVNATSGWHDVGGGELRDVHVYPGPGAPAAERDRAAVLGEFGGLGLPVKRHTWQAEKNWGYRSFESPDALTDAYVEILTNLRPLIADPGLCGAIYTQTTDVEIEVNGLMTYDRAQIKPEAARVAAANRATYAPPPVVRTVVPTSEREPQRWRYTLDAPAGEWFAPGFDDTAWREGPGGFGAEGTPGAVIGTPWTTPDIWLRRGFSLSTVPTRPHLRIYHDEDCEVYLNGRKVAELKGYLVSYKLVPLAEAGVLRAGLNVLAVRCHQTRGGQGIDVGLVDVGEPAATGPAE